MFSIKLDPFRMFRKKSETFGMVLIDFTFPENFEPYQGLKVFYYMPELTQSE